MIFFCYDISWGPALENRITSRLSMKLDWLIAIGAINYRGAQSSRVDSQVDEEWEELVQIQEQSQWGRKSVYCVSFFSCRLYLTFGVMRLAGMIFSPADHSWYWWDASFKLYSSKRNKIPLKEYENYSTHLKSILTEKPETVTCFGLHLKSIMISFIQNTAKLLWLAIGCFRI